MNKINPKKGILLIKKHNKTALKADISVAQNDEDKRLITGEILESNSDEYKKGDTVIFGKYAIYQLTITGSNYFFLEEEDIIATCNYKENV